jgi:hypothetical protein
MDFITSIEADLYAFLDQINFYISAAKILTAVVMVLLIVILSVVLSIKASTEKNEKQIAIVFQIMEDNMYKEKGIDPEDPEIRKLIIMARSGNAYHATNAQKELQFLIKKAKGEQQNE